MLRIPYFTCGYRWCRRCSNCIIQCYPVIYKICKLTLWVVWSKTRQRERPMIDWTIYSSGSTAVLVKLLTDNGISDDMARRLEMPCELTMSFLRTRIYSQTQHVLQAGTPHTSLGCCIHLINDHTSWHSPILRRCISHKSDFLLCCSLFYTFLFGLV